MDHKQFGFSEAKVVGERRDAFTPKGQIRTALQSVKRKQQNEQALEQLATIQKAASEFGAPLKMKIGAFDINATFELSDSALAKIVSIIENEVTPIDF